MYLGLADPPFFGGPGQGTRQVIELFAAFGLTAQIVSGIGFLGAGIIIFRLGSVHGLTTAAAVWESAA